MNHLGTLIQRELPPTDEHARAIDLAERARRSAWDLFNELRQHGARSSNASIEAPQRIQVFGELPNRWAESCMEIYKLGTFISGELPRDITHARAIGLASRVARRAWGIFSDLIQNGAKAPDLLSDRRTCG